jgi:hypothetical protein
VLLGSRQAGLAVEARALVTHGAHRAGPFLAERLVIRGLLCDGGRAHRARGGGNRVVPADARAERERLVELAFDRHGGDRHGGVCVRRKIGRDGDRHAGR